jgi:hypothetical protein
VRRTSTAAIQLSSGSSSNSIDPSPFLERDLDPDCEEFIVSWAREFSPDRPIAVDIRLDREESDSAVLGEIGLGRDVASARGPALRPLAGHARKVLTRAPRVGGSVLVYSGAWRRSRAARLGPGAPAKSLNLPVDSLPWRRKPPAYHVRLLPISLTRDPADSVHPNLRSLIREKGAS